jgi:hypothetical protein
MSKKTYTPAFKAKVVLEVLQGESELSAIASKYDLNPNMVRTRLLITNPEQSFCGLLYARSVRSDGAGTSQSGLPQME